MGNERVASSGTWWSLFSWLLVSPIQIVTWPLVTAIRVFDKHFLSYLLGRTVRDRRRIYSIKFIWYSDSVYLHPLVWGSALLYLLALAAIMPPGWLLLIWFLVLCLCWLTVMYNFNVIRAAILGVGVVALLGITYFATIEFAWNPLWALASHVRQLDAAVTPGFYLASAYLFAALICSEVLWAWLFHRVEIDESYVYEHGFLQGSTREPIFARGMKWETKDLLELLILGAADIQHRTKNGVKRFKNVPFASLWVGAALDSLLDYRRKGELKLDQQRDDDDEQARIQDAIHEEAEEGDDEDHDDGGDAADDHGEEDADGDDL